MTSTPSLRALLDRPGPVVAPGVFDALSAHLAAQAGFQALYLSGASISYTRLGRPDVGLVGMSEVAETVALIRARVDLPLMVDADTGYGNALNVGRTVRSFERAGASAIQLEDQVLPKRCGHMEGKQLVSTAEMVGKLQAAQDARAFDETMIVARTDGIAVEGFEAGLDRAESYLEAGADILFLEAPQTPEQLRTIGARFAGRTTLMANMVEGGRTPMMAADQLAELGFGFVIFPGGLIRALVSAGQDYLASLKAHGTTTPFRDRMLDFETLNRVLGLDEVLAAGAVAGRRVVIHHRHRPVWPRDAAAHAPQPVEGMERPFVGKVPVDEQQSPPVRFGADHMPVPDFLEKRSVLGHRCG